MPEPAPLPTPPPSIDAKLERELGGDLPCVVCKYNLRGISIRSVCPECGAQVRATILAVVDPHASELQPILRPNLVAAGLVVWSAAALAAVVVCWVPHLGALQSAVLESGRPVAAWFEPRDVARLAAMLVTLSGIGAISLIRPHLGLRRGEVALAAVGVLAFIPLALTIRSIDMSPSVAAANYLRGWAPDPVRTRQRLVVGGLIVLIALCLRPNARVLVARSLALRSGRVDRQTMLAMAVAAVVAAIGDLAGIASRMATGGVAEWLRLGAIVLIATGSAFLTLGLAGALVDCWRIARAVRSPGPSIHDVLGDSPSKP